MRRLRLARKVMVMVLRRRAVLLRRVALRRVALRRVVLRAAVRPFFRKRPLLSRFGVALRLAVVFRRRVVVFLRLRLAAPFLPIAL